MSSRLLQLALALSFVLAASLCGQLASCARCMLLMLDLYRVVQLETELERLRPRWEAQRRLWLLITLLCAVAAAVWVGVALGWWSGSPSPGR